MTEFATPRGETEWSRRAIINVVGVLQPHVDSLTLVGAHAVLLRTACLDVPLMATGDGDLGIAPGLVADAPSIEALLAAAGYEPRTAARPGLWGRVPFHETDGTRAYREKIDLLVPHGLSGAVGRNRRGVPALRASHGKLAAGNVLGLELAVLNRSVETIVDFADPRCTVDVGVAELPALILAKGSKVGERLARPAKGAVRDKDLGDLWRLMAVADPRRVVETISNYVDHSEVGPGVRQALAWTTEVLRDPLSPERAKVAFDTFVDPGRIDRCFVQWGHALMDIDLN